MHIISFRSYKAITDGKQEETNTSIINLEMLTHLSQSLIAGPEITS